MTILRDHLRRDFFPPGASLSEIARHLCRQAREERRPHRARFIADLQNADRATYRELIAEHWRTPMEIRIAVSRELGTGSRQTGTSQTKMRTIKHKMLRRLQQEGGAPMDLDKTRARRPSQ